MEARPELSAIANVLRVITLPLATTELANVPLPLKINVSEPTKPVRLKSDELAVVVAS